MFNVFCLILLTIIKGFCLLEKAIKDFLEWRAIIFVYIYYFSLFKIPIKLRSV